MGRLTWRTPELIFLDSIENSETGKKLLKDARKHKDENGAIQHTGWFRRAAAHFTTQYLKEFENKDPFGPETDLEFAYRQKLQPRGTLVRYGAETEAEKKKRLEAIPKVRC